MVKTKRFIRSKISSILFCGMLILGLFTGMALSCTAGALPDSESLNISADSLDAKALSTSGWKGVNLPAIWYDSNSWNAIPRIKAVGFNTVRIVWQTSGSASRLKEFCDRVYSNGMVAIPELHDATGSDSTGTLYNMASWWINNKWILTARSSMPFNIANEWGGNGVSDTTWRDAYKDAVMRIRNAGISNPIVIDGSGWGQNSSPIINYGDWVLGADSKKNCIFSVHMYGSWNDSNKIWNDLTAIKNKGLSVMVGEFGYNYNNGSNNLGCKVDAAKLISYCKSLSVGYLGWSWAGNDSSNAWLNMTSDWTNLNWWGKFVLNGY